MELSTPSSVEQTQLLSMTVIISSFQIYCPWNCERELYKMLFVRKYCLVITGRWQKSAVLLDEEEEEEEEVKQKFGDREFLWTSTFQKFHTR